MVEAGEASGGLAEILGKVAGYFESTVKLTKKVKSAMTYPIAVIGLAIALVNVLLIFVIPVFAAMFADFGAKLPAPTQMLIDLSNFMKSYWWAIGLGAYGVYYVVQQIHRDAERPPAKGSISRHGADLRQPWCTRSRFPASAAPTPRSCVPACPSLRTLEIVASASGKVQVEDACAEIAKHVSQGGQVSEIMAVNPFFPPMMKHMVKAGESTGNVDGMMNKIADFYDVECDATVSRAHLADRAAAHRVPRRGRRRHRHGDVPADLPTRRGRWRPAVITFAFASKVACLRSPLGGTFRVRLRMPSILIVDDLISIHEMLEAVISPTGYKTAFATDGEKALVRYKAEKFDLVLADIDMKPMDGITLLKQLKLYDPSVVVIIMTAYASTESAIQALKFGAFDYLQKPFKVDELMQTLEARHGIQAHHRRTRARWPEHPLGQGRRFRGPAASARARRSSGSSPS